MKRIQLIVLATSMLLSLPVAFANEEDPPAQVENVTVASSDCVENASQANDFFSSLSTQLAGDTALLSSEIVKAFAPFNTKQSPGMLGWPKALGIRATATTAVTTSTKADYADAAIQLRDGALVGLTFSFMASPYWSHWYSPSCTQPENASQTNWVREFQPDRLYFGDLYPIEPWTRPYFLHGIAIKAIREGLEDDEDDSGSSIAGAGTVYVGIGFDGPVGILGNSANDKTIAGTIDFQVGYQHTWINESTLQTLYDNDAIEVDSIDGLFASLKLIVTDRMFVDVEYVSPRGSAADFMSDVTTFKIGYNLGDTAADKQKDAAAKANAVAAN